LASCEYVQQLLAALKVNYIAIKGNDLWHLAPFE